LNDLEIILPFLKSDYGKKIMNEFTMLVNDKYPWYYDELKGISHGSDIDFDQVNLFSVIYL
jgi:hypothetical protein